jgi:hypothetical protein
MLFADHGTPLIYISLTIEWIVTLLLIV